GRSLSGRISLCPGRQVRASRARIGLNGERRRRRRVDGHVLDLERIESLDRRLLALHPADACSPNRPDSGHRFFERPQRSHVQPPFGCAEFVAQPGAELSRVCHLARKGGLTMPNYGYHLARAKGAWFRRLYKARLGAIIHRSIPVPATLPFDVFSYSGESMLPEQVASIRSLLQFAGRPRQFTVVSDGTHSKRSLELLQQLDPSARVSQMSAWQPPG